MLAYRHQEGVNFQLATDLAVTGQASPNPVAVRGQLSYMLQVVNHGPLIAYTVTLTDTLPPTTTFVSATGTGWSCSVSKGVLTCTRSDLAAGAAPPITLVVSPTAPGAITNTAAVSSDLGDPDTGNNSTQITVNAAVQTDLALTLTATPDPVNEGNALMYTINATNVGPARASGVVVSDTLPAGVTFVRASGAGWSCSFTNGVVTCTRASLAVGAAPPIAVVVTPTKQGILTNTVSIMANELELTPGNNMASTQTTVQPYGLFLPLIDSSSAAP